VPAAPSAAAPSAALPAATPATLSPAKSAKEITVETDHYIAVFTTQGARLKSFKFKKYRSSVDEHSPPFEIVRTAPGVPLPLGVRWQAPTPFEDSEIVYSVQGNDLKLSGDGKGSLVFQGQNGNGAVIQNLSPSQARLIRFSSKFL
jgi:membrane protein insertase, YidC/Oxa1 family, N-terminal domain